VRSRECPRRDWAHHIVYSRCSEANFHCALRPLQNYHSLPSSMASTASPWPQLFLLIAALRHLFSYNFPHSSRSHHPNSPTCNPRPYSTRIYHPQLRDSSMLESREDTKSLATSATSSVPVSSSSRERPLAVTGEQRVRSDLHQQDLYFVPAPEHSASPHTTAETTHPLVSPRLDHPPPSVRPAKTEKDVESLHEWLEDSTQRRHSFPRLEVKPSWSRRCWLHWLTAYRILIALAIVINVLVLGLLLGLYSNTSGSLIATAANLLVSVLVRQEDLINVSFGLVARLPSSLPISLRKIIADFHHYGGVHVGTAVSALVWYIVFVAINTQQCIRAYKEGTMTAYHWADISTCYVFLCALLLMCLTAISCFRRVFHNTFERTHRFAGWAALFVLWVNSGIHTRTAPLNTPTLEKQPALWLLAATTVLIILPWLRIRQIPVAAHPISSREIKLSFPCRDLPYTSTSRFSTSPLIEWHAFATIPCHSGSSSASIIVSAAGDWTKDIVAHPPSKLWIRKPATSNFLSFTPVFNSVLLVATGAGIGPMLSLLASPAVKRMMSEGKRIRVLWCVYEPDALHWDVVQDAIRAVDPKPVILNSKAGRPQLAFEARYLAQVHDLEAVMIVSNKKVTDEVVSEVKAHGRAAYGAVFDS